MFEEIKLLSCLTEGTDDTGKNTATIGMCDALLEATELDVRGRRFVRGERGRHDFELLFTNFPQYFLPTGFLIRTMNSKLPGQDISGMDKFLLWDKEQNGIENSFLEELFLRESLYALDRLFAWIMIDCWMQITHYQRPFIHVSDRGFLSQINTVSHVLKKHHQEDAFDSVIDYVDLYDRGFEKFLDPLSIILHKGELAPRNMVGKKEVDELESAPSQELAIQGYLELLKRDKFKTTLINAYDGAERRNRKAIVADMLEASGIHIIKKASNYEPIHRPQDFASKGFEFIRPVEVVKLFFPREMHHIKSIDEGEGSLTELQFEWTLCYFGDDDYSKNRYGVGKKDKLVELENEIGFLMMDIFSTYYPRDDIVSRIPGVIKESAFFMFHDKRKDVLRLIKFLESERGLPPGLSRFVSQIFLDPR